MKTEYDFNCGEFRFYLKNTKNEEFIIPFFNGSFNINDLWKFLENIILKTEPLILPLFHAGVDTILYTEPIGKKEIRFVVINTIKLDKKLKEGELLHYSMLDAEIDIDIKIKKKEFVKSFYSKLRAMFKEYESVAYFEPPLIDFDGWIKDSEIIKNYLNC